MDINIDAIEDQKSGERPPWASVLLFCIVILVSFFIIGPTLGIILALPFMPGGVANFFSAAASGQPHPEIKTALYIVQISTTFLGFAAGPALYWWVYEKKNPWSLLTNRGFTIPVFVLTLLVMLSFLPINSFFIEWNANLVFPDWLSGFEKLIKESEARNAKLIEQLTKFDSFAQFAVAFFAISILAGFAEEYCFRGMLQPLLFKWTGNIHAAIWLSAILFSTLHLQFLGFVPRVLLGALFGYLYYGSGNLLVPILAHIINNGIIVIVIYLNQKGVVDIDAESNKSLPLPVILFSLIVFSALSFYFYRFTKNSKSTLT